MTEALTLTSREIVGLIFVGYCFGIVTIALAGVVLTFMNK